MKKLCKSTTNRQISGVCAGVAEYLGCDPTLIRLGWAIATCFSCGTGLLLYLVCAVIIPDGDGVI